MKRQLSKISIAALAGASCLLSSQASKAAITVVPTNLGPETFKNGTYDVILFDLTSMTGSDATLGGSGQDAEIYALNGTFTVNGGSMALIGTAATEAGDFLLPYAQANYVAASSTALHSSYVPFTNDVAAVVTGVSGAAKAAGTATSITDTWYTTPAAKSGQGGGVEPGVDGPHATVASGSSSDPYANNGMLAEILITPGASVSFSGLYSDYGNQAGATTTFSYSPNVVTSSSSPTGTNKIISLVTTAAPTGTAPNGYGTAPLGTLTVTNEGGPGKYFPGYFNIPGGAATGFIAVKGFLPADVPEVYALQVAINGVELLPTDTRLATIIADIEGSDSNISSGVTTVLGSPYAGIFPGYDILVPTSIAGGATPYFAFDFSSPTDSDSALGAVTVTSIAAVPEPATAAGVILGAAGLLLGRRKNRVQAV